MPTKKEVFMTKTKFNTKALVENALMIAFATVLSLVKLVEMPYGGSVTLASMVPILIVSYRNGIASGVLSGLVYAAIQQLLGLNNLSYVTGWQSVLAVILLDYIIAFTVIGLAGLFKGKLVSSEASLAKRQSVEFACGMAFACLLRYILHTVAGATVWAGLSIPTEAALVYSIGYNATYMIPETIVNVAAAAYIGSSVDFAKAIVTRIGNFVAGRDKRFAVARAVLPKVAGLLATATTVIAVCIIAPNLQDAESGKFSFDGLANLNVTALVITLSVGIVATVACLVTKFILDKIANKD